MRQVILHSPSGHHSKIKDSIEEHGGKNTIDISSENAASYITFLPNRNVNNLMNSLSNLDDLQVSIQSSGAIALYPPQNQEPEKAADVQPKSSLEVYMAGIQSVGSWFGLLGYSCTAGIIVWIGLYINISYLLVAAMLVAPFAGPAMNAALATAAGRGGLLRDAVLRYAVAVFTGVAVSFLLTMIFPIHVYTSLINTVSQVSAMAILLPLTAGIAGAINVCQSDKDSLVSGAAVGILVAASLAPPVGLLGIGLYMMDAALIWSSLFRIVLQLLGIHIAATVVFYFFGNIDHSGVRFVRGKKWVGQLSVVIVCLGLAALMYAQFNDPVFLRKASRKTALNDVLEQELKSLQDIHIIQHDVEFTGRDLENKPVVKYSISVLPADSASSETTLKKRVKAHLKNSMKSDNAHLYPVYNISVAAD